jgi:hypothetical protein
MHDEIESVARAFYLTAECSRGWDREPEILKEGFRARARLVINTVDGFRRQLSPHTQSVTFRTPQAQSLHQLQTAPYNLEPGPPGFLAVLSGPEHVYHIANKAHRHLTGHRAIIDKPVREAVPELKEQGYLDILDEVYETGRPYMAKQVPLRIRMRRNGPLEDRLIDFAYRPLVNESGRRLGVLVEGHDVTGLMRLLP